MAQETMEKPAGAAKSIRLVNLNKVTLSGRLAQEPQVRAVGEGHLVAQFPLAVNRRYKDKAGDWQEEVSYITVTTWNKAAERCQAMAHKGSAVYVEGRLRSETWEKDGEKRYGVKVEALQIQFLERGKAKVTAEDIPFGE
jgi:single-strand DNA-binding protein